MLVEVQGNDREVHGVTKAPQDTKTTGVDGQPKASHRRLGKRRRWVKVGGCLAALVAAAILGIYGLVMAVEPEEVTKGRRDKSPDAATTVELFPGLTTEYDQSLFVYETGHIWTRTVQLIENSARISFENGCLYAIHSSGGETKERYLVGINRLKLVSIDFDAEVLTLQVGEDNDLPLRLGNGDRLTFSGLKRLDIPVTLDHGCAKDVTEILFLMAVGPA